MKNLYFSILFLFATNAVAGQVFDVPSKDFSMHLGSNAITLNKGDSTSLDVTILKSKEVMKSKIRMSLSSFLPKGVKVKFTPEKGMFDKTQMLVLVGAETLPGTYTMVVTAETHYKSKGVIIKLVVL